MTAQAEQQIAGRAAPPPGPIELALARLDAWLETMRGPGGYGGPAAHWWQQSLLYTGPGLDWRYEGIIAGYLALWERGGGPAWLAKARRAGDDLLAGRLPDGHYAASAFEINPAAAGTPHEAAADAGLLLLARALRGADEPGWEPYAAAAERNLRGFYLARLWDAEARAFRDWPHAPSFVPNKAATACEALFLLAELRGDADLVQRYALPNLERLLAHQIRGGPLDGAIAQNSFAGRRVERYFPIYIARCAPALLAAHRHSGEARYADAALRALAFVARLARPDGSLPTVVYPGGRESRGPEWLAPLADVLRAAALLRPLGLSADLSAVEARLLAAQDASGGFQTASGFAGHALGGAGGPPELRDLLHVVGWCDKVLRHLAERSAGPLPPATSAPFASDCALRGARLHLLETPAELLVTRRGRPVYRWRKGEPAPALAAPAFWFR